MTQANPATLHIISKSPTHQQRYSDIANALLDDDAILFIEGGVYACCGTEATALLAATNNIYALSIDAQSRGLANTTPAAITLISDQQFVELCCQYHKTLSWF